METKNDSYYVYAYKPEIKDKWVLGLFNCEMDFILSAYVNIETGEAFHFMKSSICTDIYGNPYFCRYRRTFYLSDFIEVGD